MHSFVVSQMQPVIINIMHTYVLTLLIGKFCVEKTTYSNNHVMRVNLFSYSETRKPADSVHKHHSY